MTERLSGIYIRNTVPSGFALSNNQGLREASGEITVFLNSDIRAESSWLDLVRREVQDSALYGINLSHQCVYGFILPYLEGWCIAATRRTWEFLEGWNSKSYRDVYWEDNDLALRALQKGYRLMPRNWPVYHKGGITISNPTFYGDAYERNRASFASTVRRVCSNHSIEHFTEAQCRFKRLLSQPSDIQHHLPLLFSLARGNVLELGVRTGISTCALVAGVEIHSGCVWSVDVNSECRELFQNHQSWTFICGDSKDPGLLQQAPACLDLLLLDTEHTYTQVKSELELWAPRVKPGGTICIHDTESFPEARRAVIDFCRKSDWNPRFLKPSNGMSVIEVPIVQSGKSWEQGFSDSQSNSALRESKATTNNVLKG